MILSEFLKYEWGFKLIPPEKTSLKKPSLIRTKRIIFIGNVSIEDNGSAQYTLSAVHGLPSTLTDLSLVLQIIGDKGLRAE